MCPAGYELEARSRAKDGSYVQYERHGCSDCPLRPRCFSQKSTRRVIRRLPVDDAKDALREVMTSPRARLAYAKRKAMVEPVFSFMRGLMNFRRFRRYGLSKVQLEFSLFVAAYNLGRVLAAQRAVFWLFASHRLMNQMLGFARIGRLRITSCGGATPTHATV